MIAGSLDPRYNEIIMSQSPITPELLAPLVKQAQQALPQLRADYQLPSGEKLPLYLAGLKGGQLHFGWFARDLLTSALMLDNPVWLRATAIFALETLGKKRDAHTGEVPGRVIHEFNRVIIRGQDTRYNAGDTTALLFVVLGRALRQGGMPFLAAYRPQLALAAGYLCSCIRDGLYWEDPRRSGAECYALESTYWKDSWVPQRKDADPDYPVVYTLVQAQAVAALHAAARLAAAGWLTQDELDFEALAQALSRSLWTNLWNEQIRFPLIALDRSGPIPGIASDGLHLLAYLESSEVPPDKLAALAAGAASLATNYGYRTYAPGQPDYDPESYHWGSIWPFDNFFIALGAKKHKLARIFKVASSIANGLAQMGFTELWYDHNSHPIPVGSDLQLWSVLAPQALLRLIA